MKRILLALSILAVALPTLRQAEAADVSVDFFYNNLSDGSWVDVEDYGYCWQPSVAVSNHGWRPYSDGYWAYTDVGWTWVSYEDFGWATYHYGRWARLADTGWVWVPGRRPTWGPAWVSWRTGGDYIGWAPLPPGGGETIYEGRPISGHVDFDFNIGPSYYNFVDMRYIGEPVLRERIFASDQNLTYINRTVNVTNITYNNSTVYNYGPDYNTVSSYSNRPVQRLTLERNASADFTAAAQSRSFTKVQGEKLMVSAPTTIQQSATPIAPPSVKTKIQKPKFDHGFGTDAKAEAELKQRMKSEDSKNIPPPTTLKPRSGATAAEATGSPGASPAASVGPEASAAVSSTPASTITPASGQGRGKNKKGEGNQPPISPSSATGGSPAAEGAPTSGPTGSGKGHRGKHGEQPVTAPAPATGGSPAAESAPTPVQSGQGKGHHGKQGEQSAPAPATGSSPAAESAPAPAQSRQGKAHRGKQSEQAPATLTNPGQSGAEPVTPEGAQPQNKHKGERNRPTSTATPAAETTGQPGGDAGPGGRGKHRGENSAAAVESTPTANGGGQGEGSGAGQGRHRKDRELPPEGANPTGNPNAAAPSGPPPGEPRHGEGKKKAKGQPEVSPTPAE